ncbi:hypothetical protein BGZ80_010087 [Entomortierella chlamydospora]|uniref:Secreted protein n=1 Tax=Entomortierella chlamydospora TaxID=101097 RepID=A0A9P6T092_9FUNG|nr:hypothetical protein BGZ79_008366 [Entomortierella chlamydospora]KAG0015022.1 hypothetical protein BGZ80_010087 [Entomortierella chlamydospora]
MVKIASTLIFSLTALLSIVEAATNPGACILTVPRHPLTAKGLAKPYILHKGNCDQTNPDQQVFAEATIFDPHTKKFSVYHPLVINQGTKPAIKPVVPVLPKGAIVGLWFGANSDSVTLVGDIGTCVNGLSSQDIFGQVAFCNAEAFFAAVKAAGKCVKIPPIGTDKAGRPCPTTRFFGIIDQDQSDNVNTVYLQSCNKFAQNTKANCKALKNATKISNGSDNNLVAALLDPHLGCKSFTAPSLMEKGVMLSSMALNELQATLQKAPVALVPANDPMVLSNNQLSLDKVNAYRAGVDQPLITSLKQASPKKYCINFDKIAPKYIKAIKDSIINQPSPSPDVANNLFTFMGQRYFASWTNLGCDVLLKKTSAITVTTNKHGVATAVHFCQSSPIPSASSR